MICSNLCRKYTHASMELASSKDATNLKETLYVVSTQFSQRNSNNKMAIELNHVSCSLLINFTIASLLLYPCRRLPVHLSSAQRNPIYGTCSSLSLAYSGSRLILLCLYTQHVRFKQDFLYTRKERSIRPFGTYGQQLTLCSFHVKCMSVHLS